MIARKPKPRATQAEVKDSRAVMVVYGRNLKVKEALFEFLQAIDLRPLEWSELVSETRQGTPYIGDVLETAFDKAQAVVVLFTPDDEARLRVDLVSDDDPETETHLNGQVRPNVLIEAGMALGKDSSRTIVVQVGRVRPASDILGRHVIMLDNEPGCRNSLAQRLRQAGCAVNTTGQAWLKKGEFSLQLFSPAESVTNMERLAAIVADAVIDKLGPLLDGFTKKVVDIFPSPLTSPSFNKGGNLSASRAVTEGIQTVRELVDQGAFEAAEEGLKALVEAVN